MAIFKMFVVAVAVIVASAKAATIVSPLAYSAAYATPLTYANSAVGTTHENVVRSFGGTVSHYSKAVDTPFSSVRKSDTRINNNVYAPAIAKTLTYAAAPVAYAHASHAIAAPLSYAAHPVAAPVALAYSPAAAVAHATFDGFGAHYFY